MLNLREIVAGRSGPIEVGRSISRVRLLTIAAGLLATIASSPSVYPHQLAYFNEAAGGPENGHHHLLHSNLDWGQDVILAKEWMERNGIDPHECGFYSYGVLSDRGLLSGGPPNNSTTHRWEIISPNRLHDYVGKLVDTGISVRQCRVGYTLWAFPVGCGNLTTERSFTPVIDSATTASAASASPTSTDAPW